MKNYLVSVFTALMIITGMGSCFHHRHDVSVSVWDDEDEYEMEADYRRNRSHDVQVYLNNHLLTGSSVSIRNGYINDEVVLDDKTTFRINTNPGELSIRINKNENSEESCEKVRRICEDLKVIIEDN